VARLDPYDLARRLAQLAPVPRDKLADALRLRLGARRRARTFESAAGDGLIERKPMDADQRATDPGAGSGEQV
jgi:hypothetical protein